MNRILLILFIVLVLLLGIYFFVILLAPKKEQKDILPPIQVAPSQSPKVTIPISPLPSVKEGLKVVKVEPKENLSLGYNPVTEVKFTFSEDIDLSNFLIEVSPNTQIRIIPDATTHTYAISAKEGWPEGINTITIKAGTKSFVYKINIQYPKNPPPDADI